MKIVRVTAMWCMSCLAMKRVWRKVLPDFPDTEIIDYDFDQDKEAIEQYSIGDILPELIVFSGDVEVKRIIGEKSKKEFRKILEDIYENN